MIDFVVVSSDLRPYVLDTRVKRGAELSTDHHLVVSWIRWQRKEVGQTWQTQTYCEGLLGTSGRALCQGGLQLPPSGRASHRFRGRLGTLSPSGPCSLPPLSTRQQFEVVDARSLVPANVVAAIPRTRWWTPEAKLKLRSPDGPGGKKSGLGGVRIFLNPTDLPSNEEAEAGDSEVDSSITQAEVTEVVRKLRSGKAPGVDEIRPEYLKSLDVVGLSWLTRLCSIALESNPRIQEEQCGFRPGRGTLDQLYTLQRVLEGLWEFAQPVHMCFVDLEKAFDRVPRGILWGCSMSMGSGAFAKGCSVSVRPEQELGSHCRQTFSMHVLERFAAECEAAGMRISTSKSEAMVLDRKRVACPLRVSGEVLPQVEEFKYLGVLFTSEGKMEREIDRQDWCSVRRSYAVGVLRTVVVKKELSRKSLDLPVNLRSHPHLWS
ncbi:hypothetical protein L3Q82_010810 [Scortum barcoo]|uniref:Uncharacterized protein n=1 Tax=Scortum barcoo TaxID=214431 RepID=A0ACB8W8M6_9TELE|nr:hypothetical protein L3Q82_010810 [Scortum barcoo]